VEDRATLGSDLSATMDFKEWGLPPGLFVVDRHLENQSDKPIQIY